MTPESYVLLAEHLTAADTVFDEFVASTEYIRQTTGLGRYPRRRVVFVCPESRIHRAIELSLDLNDDGDHFSEFKLGLPYSLWAGAWLDVTNKRYSDPGFRPYNSRRWERVLDDLAEKLQECHTYLSGITEEHLLNLTPTVYNHDLTGSGT